MSFLIALILVWVGLLIPTTGFTKNKIKIRLVLMILEACVLGFVYIYAYFKGWA